MATIVLVLSGCVPSMLTHVDRYQVCTVGVIEKFESVQILSAHPAGAPGSMEAVGRVGDVVLQSAFVFPPVAIALIPIIAMTAAEAHNVRDAAAGVKDIIADVDVHSLARALTAAVAANAPDARCHPAAGGAEAGGTPDAIVEIDSLAVGMGHSLAKQTLYTVVGWRMLDEAGDRELAAATTTCTFAFATDSDASIDDRSRKRAQVEDATARTGQHIGMNFFTSKMAGECRSR